MTPKASTMGLEGSRVSYKVPTSTLDTSTMAKKAPATTKKVPASRFHAATTERQASGAMFSTSTATSGVPNMALHALAMVQKAPGVEGAAKRKGLAARPGPSDSLVPEVGLEPTRF